MKIFVDLKEKTKILTLKNGVKYFVLYERSDHKNLLDILKLANFSNKSDLIKFVRNQDGFFRFALWNNNFFFASVDQVDLLRGCRRAGQLCCGFRRVAGNRSTATSDPRSGRRHPHSSRCWQGSVALKSMARPFGGALSCWGGRFGNQFSDHRFSAKRASL